MLVSDVIEEVSDNIQEVDDSKYDEPSIDLREQKQFEVIEDVSDNIQEVDDSKYDHPSIVWKEQKQFEVYDEKGQEQKYEVKAVSTADDSLMEAEKMPLPTLAEWGVPPTNLSPGVSMSDIRDVSMSEISSLLGVDQSEEENKMDHMMPVKLDMTNEDEDYVKLETIEEVPVSNVCWKTNFGQMIQSRFFLFFLITVPTVAIPCCFLPFAFFNVDHIFIFVFLLFPAMFIYFYFYPEEDDVFLDDFSDDLLDEESDNFFDELVETAGIKNYNPEHVYAF